jgi:hypothetical protein
MTNLLNIVDPLAILALNLVWVYGLYTFGMLLASRLLKGEDTEVTMGIGPQLVAFSLAGTRYKLRLIPLLAQVSARDLNSLWRVLLLKMAGPLAVLVGAVVAVFLFLLTGIKVPQRSGAIVAATARITDAEGHDLLHEGDFVVRAGDHDVQDGLDLAWTLTRWEDGPMVLEIERGGGRSVVELVRTPTEVPGKQYLMFRSITALEHPGVWAAVARTPAALGDVCAVQWRNALLTDERLREDAGFDAEYYFDFFVWVFLGLGVLLAVPLDLAVEVGMHRLQKRMGTSRISDRLLDVSGWVIAILVVLPIVAFILVGSKHYLGRSLFDSPFLMDAFRDFPANIYWRVSF